MKKVRNDMEATYIKDLEGFTGNAKLFKVDPPMEYNKPWDDEDPPANKTEFVVVSAANVMMSGPETYIFPSDENGHVISWGELDGSYRGGLSHSEALSGAGYTTGYTIK